MDIAKNKLCYLENQLKFPGFNKKRKRRKKKKGTMKEEIMHG